MEQTVVDVLEALEATTKRLEKEELLKKGLSSPFIRNFFVTALDPYRTYGLQNIEVPAQHSDAEQHEGAWATHLTILFDILDELRERSLVGNEARTVVSSFLQNMSKLEQKWFHRCILKNLRCGVDAKTINKIIPGLIPVFEVQLAEEVKAKRTGDKIEIIDKITYPVWCDYKLDGLRTVAILEDGVVTLRSRKGHEIETLPTIAAGLAEFGGTFVLDGEAMGKDWNESQTILSSTVKLRDDSKMTYNIFDCIPLDIWKSQGKSQPYEDRRAVAASLSCLANPQIRLVEGKLILNPTDLKKFFEYALSLGHEGIMVKDPKASYEFKRSKAIRKLKPKQSWDGTIVGMFYGDPNGKWASRFGGFQVQFTKNGPITNVGGGFTDAQRAFFTNDLLANSTIHNGRTIEVEGQEMTKDGVIRFPVYKGIRSPGDK